MRRQQFAFPCTPEIADDEAALRDVWGEVVRRAGGTAIPGEPLTRRRLREATVDGVSAFDEDEVSDLVMVHGYAEIPDGWRP